MMMNQRIFICLVWWGLVLPTFGFCAPWEETLVENFPAKMKLGRCYPEEQGGFYYRDFDDGRNAQFGSLVFFENGGFVLVGEDKSWINEKWTLPWMERSVYFSKDMQRFAAFARKDNVPRMLYENETRIFLLPDDFEPETVWYESLDDGRECLMAIFSCREGDGRFQYMDGVLCPIYKHQMCFQRTFYDSQKKPLFQIRTNRLGKQYISNLEVTHDGAWDAITAFDIGHNGNYVLSVLQNDRYSIYEYRDNRLSLLKEFGRGAAVEMLRYDGESDIPCVLVRDKKSVSWYILHPEKEICVGPYDNIWDGQLSADGNHFMCIAREKTDGKLDKEYLIIDGNRIPKSYHIYQGILSKDGKSFLLSGDVKEVKDGREYDREVLECNGKIIASGDQICPIITDEDEFQYLVFVQDGQTLRVIQNEMQVQHDNALAAAFLKKSANYLYFETAAGQKKYLCSSSGEKYGPFTVINHLICSPDGKHWATIVQIPENQKYSILLDGERGPLYDNIIQVSGVYEVSHWHTYGLRDGKWYRLDIRWED